MEKYAHVAKEEFKDFSTLLSTLRKRPNNSAFRGRKRSSDPDYGFTLTHSYEEAEKMLGTGYLDILSQLKSDVKAKSKIGSKYTADVQHPVPHSGIVGYCPCIPNAIMGLPNSMITSDRKPMKRKTLSILYCIRGAGYCGVEYFTGAGAALLSAIDIIERSGIQTQINLCFKFSEDKDHKELTFPSVIIKHYGERYSLQKVSFPLSHPSMFRRIGFKWLETFPDLVETNGYVGYGQQPNMEKARNTLEVDKSTYLISTDEIQNFGCDVNKILKRFEVI